MNIASLATKYRTENPFWEIQKDEFLVSGMVFNFIPINDTVKILSPQLILCSMSTVPPTMSPTLQVYLHT